MMRRSFFLMRKALHAWRDSLGVVLLTIATLAASLILLGLYAMALKNLEGVALIWGRSAQIAVYLDHKQGEAQEEQLRHTISTWSNVEIVLFLSPEEALERFRHTSKEAAALVEGVEASILPPMLELWPTRETADLTSVTEIAEKIGTLPGVLGVDFGKEEFETLQTVIGVLRTVGLGGGIFIALAIAFIIANTIRLSVYARLDEITILRLVGATNWYIRAPFLLEGAQAGLCAGLLASGLLFLADHFFASKLSQLLSETFTGMNVSLFAWDIAAIMLLVGMILGSLGSSLAVRRALASEP